jgi:hypothetical protein
VRLSMDSLPAMKIPLVMYTVYSYQSFLAIAVFKIVTFFVKVFQLRLRLNLWFFFFFFIR